MKKITEWIVVAVAVVGLLTASKPVAEGTFDPKTLETVQGKVLSVEKVPRAQGASYGVHLSLQTDNGTIPVHLGPGWYVENQTPHIEPNDIVTVTGSRVIAGGKPAIIATQVNKGNAILRLRDEKGAPQWRRGDNR